MQWDEARTAAHALGAPLHATEVPLADALGLVLAEPLVARAALPPFDTAALDGYAVAVPGPWQVRGSLRAGEAAAGDLALGTAVEIATGAPTPPGVSVLPYEHALRVGDQVWGDAEPGANVRAAGEEARRGDLLVPAGTVVTPPVLGLAAAVGYDGVSVRPRPVVTAIVTGEELLTAGLPGHGRVRDALGPLLPGLVDALGGRLVDLRHVPDDRARLAVAVTSRPCDVVLVTGGCSQGAADHAHGVLADLGARFAVDGVACRPGHPQFLARLPEGRLVVGLPGNPFAALVAALTLLAPVLDAARGLRLAGLPPASNGGIRSHLRMTRLVPATVDGRTATPLPHAGSARLRGLVQADALAVVPPGESGQQPVRLLALPWRAARHDPTIGAADAAADHVWSDLR